jgi:YidC/Oxa1 family membrane protein insertase
MMDWIYIAISWILLRWHQMWDAILPDRAFLATNWDWILAIVFLVITVRVILFPIFVKQIRSQRAMQAIQPKMKELQEKHKGDRETLQKEMMELYRKEKVNPLMGCLPIFLQIPVFLGLFHVLQRLDPVQTMNTTIYGWSQGEWTSAVAARLFDAPIAARFASSASDLANMDASGVVVKVVAGVLVIIMMATTFLTSRQMILKTGWSVDPQQRMIQKLMLYGIPFSLLLSGWYFPIGVIIYWVTQNLFSLGQQFWVLHKYPPPVMPGATPAKAVAGRGGETKAAGDKGRAIAAGGAKGIVQQEKSGLFRRKRDSAPAAPVTPRLDGKALAPKPGAKPVTAKKTMSSKKKGGAKR